MVAGSSCENVAGTPCAFRIWPWTIIAVIVYTFFATAGRWYLPFSRDPNRVRTLWSEAHYALLAEGFLRGQLTLAVKPSMHLLTHPDPLSDKQLLYRHALLDAALYRGNYYMYHGPAPVITVYLPLRVILGVYPPAPAVVTLFLVMSFILQLWLLRDVWRRHVWHAWPGLWYVCAVVLLLQNGALFAMSASEFFEIACASAAWWMTAGVACAYVFWTRGRRPVALAGAAACVVLATASRPHFAVAAMAGLAATVPLLWRHRAMAWIGAACVCLCGAAGLMWYNAARFGDPFEWGVRYQANMLSTAWTPVTSAAAWWECVRINLWLYLLQPPRVISTFPYVRAYINPAWISPAGAYSVWREEMAGFLFTTPILLLGIGAGMALAICTRRHAYRRVRTIVMSIAGMYLLMAGVLVSMPATAMRYALDVVPGLLLAACLAIVACDNIMQGQQKRWATLVWRGAVVGAAAVGCVLHIMLGFSGRSDAFRYLFPGWTHPWRVIRQEVRHLTVCHREESITNSSGIVYVRFQVRTDSGTRDGLFCEWHDNGVMKSRGQYRDGAPAGWWTWWHTNGVKAMQGRFADGTHDQWWIWWWPDGQVEKESYYVRGVHVQTREN